MASTGGRPAAAIGQLSARVFSGFRNRCQGTLRGHPGCGDARSSLVPVNRQPDQSCDAVGASARESWPFPVRADLADAVAVAQATANPASATASSRYTYRMRPRAT